MPINTIKLADDSLRYIARMYFANGQKSRTKHFKTREEAKNQLRDWRDIENRKKTKAFPSDCTREQNLFLYKGRRQMNKQQIFDAFDGFLSMKNIVNRDGEFNLVGKYCVISPLEDGNWDVWLCNPSNLSEGLGTGRINNLVALFSTSSSVWRKLTGEADTQLPLEDLKPVLLGNHARFGLKKKQVYSEAALRAKTDRLRQINQERE